MIGGDPPLASTFVLKIAERCNLNCSYCYMYKHADQSWRFRPKGMTDEVFDQLLVVAGMACRQRAKGCSPCLPHRSPTVCRNESTA